ncbi:cell wall integrity and stress response component 4-like isoform X2 [Haliotis rufescens]|uniref:cell wall integrity and stress response component 4-like isoform X2 n=1 Tax=Haliotis rufescens TaxID=6454 RepID=UPI00201F5FF2|nr:cell wall integrity and stress response component 4-like isoform X2 [Haliotis rufescens]
MRSGIPLMFLLWIGMIVYAHSSVADELTLEIDITPPEDNFTLICSSNSNESMAHTTWYRDGAIVLNSRKIENNEHCDKDKPSSIPGERNYTDSYYDKYISGRVSVSCTYYQHNLTLTTELTVHDGSVWRCEDSRNRGSNNLTLDFPETSRTDQTLPSRPSTVQQLPFTSTQIPEGSTQDFPETSRTDQTLPSRPSTVQQLPFTSTQIPEGSTQVKSANSTISITSSTTSTTSPTSTTTLTAFTTFTKSNTPAVSQASVPVYLIIGLVAALLVVLIIIFVLVVCRNRIARVARRYIVTRKRPQVQELRKNEKANKGRRMSDINPNKKSDFVRSVLGSNVDP